MAGHTVTSAVKKGVSMGMRDLANTKGGQAAGSDANGKAAAKANSSNGLTGNNKTSGTTERKASSSDTSNNTAGITATHSNDKGKTTGTGMRGRR